MTLNPPCLIMHRTTKNEVTDMELTIRFFLKETPTPFSTFYKK